MTEKEVIVVKNIPEDSYQNLVYDCVKYAIISSPFTVDRMNIPDVERRIINISKGKIAERLFKYFCSRNNIPADFKICETPFWTVDNRDFVLYNKEWDIKNNFIYYSGKKFADKNYTDLPALIPNRVNGDQWSGRLQKKVKGTKGIAFLFTFLKNGNLYSGSRGPGFLSIRLTKKQKEFLDKLYKRYKGLPQNSRPFPEEKFWIEMEKRGSIRDTFKLRYNPHLIITGFADSRNWNLFKNTGKFDIENNYQSYLSPKWYSKTRNGSINFMDNSLWTKITNATVPVSRPPSFSSLISNQKAFET